jgi:predicted PurR-regulated permease PerM
MDAMSDVTESPAVEKWTPRQVITGTLFVVGLLVSLALLYQFRTVVLMLFVAILLGTGLKPAVNFLASRGLSRNYGQILIYVVLIAVFLGFLVLALTPILEQSTSVTGLAREYYTDARLALLNSQSTIVRNLGMRLSPTLDMQNLTDEPQTTPATPEQVAEETAKLVSTTLNYAGIAGKTLFIIIAILLMTFYWTLESERAFRTLLFLFPSQKRADIREVIDAVEGKLGAYLFGEGILMLAIGSLSLVAYLIIGLPNALVLGLIAGVMEAVPVVGPILGAVPAVLVAASTNPGNIVWVIVASIIIQLAENNLLVPRVMNRSVGVNPLLTILSIAALSSLIGLPGAVLAVPIAAIIQFLINRFVIAPVREPELKPEGRDNLSYLRLQIQELANDSRKRTPTEKEGIENVPDGERLEEMIESMANDLDQILAQVPQAVEVQG